MLGRAGLVDSPAGGVVHGACGGVPIAPGAARAPRAAAAEVAVVVVLVILVILVLRLGLRESCPWACARSLSRYTS